MAKQLSDKQKEVIKRNQWQKGKSGNPKGRPKKLVNRINNELKREGYKQLNDGDINDAIKTILNLPLSKLQDILDKENDDYPLFYKLVAKELVSKNGGAMLEKLLNRSFGMPTGKTEIEGGLTLVWKEELTKE